MPDCTKIKFAKHYVTCMIATQCAPHVCSPLSYIYMSVICVLFGKILPFAGYKCQFAKADIS